MFPDARYFLKLPPALLRVNLLAMGFVIFILAIGLLAGPQAVSLLEASFPPCVFKHITHLPCLFCGFTRSFVAIPQGQWSTSLNYHPLGLPFLTGIFGFFLLSLLNQQAAMKALQLATRRQTVFGIIALLFATWIWKLTHNPAFW